MSLVRILSLLATFACVAVTASAASATTFCVNSPAGCSGTPALTITGALATAAGSPGTDTIEIAGSHTYDESGLIDAPGNPVNIIGIGTPSPIITTAGSEPALLNVKDTASTISNMAFELPSGGTGEGLTFGGATATGITVTGAAGDGAIGITMSGAGATLSNSSVTLPTESSQTTTALYISGNGVEVTDSKFSATLGVDFNCQGSTLSRVQVKAPIGVRSYDNSNTIEDSLVLDEGTAAGGTEYGIQANGSGTVIAAHDDTVLGVGQGDIGIGATGGGALSLSDSIVMGFTADLSTIDAGSSLNTDYDDWMTQVPYSGGAAVVAGAHDLHVAPDFVDAATGDYRLAVGSPLIDAGDPAPLAAGQSATDVFGADRLVAGHGGCSFIRDIGAAEFQAVAPTATASAPPTGVAGAPVAFSGTKSCGPGALSPITSWSWSFGDGASGTGATVSHAFAAPGKHTVTLTVRTAAGHTASTTVTVTVSAAPLPRLSGLAISPRTFGTKPRHHHPAGGTVTYRLSVVATVKFVVEARLPGRRGAHGTCGSPSRRNRHARKCTRTVALRGGFTERGRAGANQFRFTGVAHGHKLAKGNYVLVGTASAGGRAGTPQSVRFRIS